MSMLPIDAPDLLPLRNSAEFDQLEAELKSIFLAVFDNMVRSRERALNLYGMPHLGEVELLERAIKSDGLAVMRRDATQLSFLIKAWRARNPRRGFKFLETYLQTVFPNDWSVHQLWHPIDKADEYPDHLDKLGDKEAHFLTSRVLVGIGASAIFPSDLLVVEKALRSTLAARLVLDIILTLDVHTGYRLANGAGGMMVFNATGSFEYSEPPPITMTINNVAAGVVKMNLEGTLET